MGTMSYDFPLWKGMTKDLQTVEWLYKPRIVTAVLQVADKLKEIDAK